MLLNMVEEDGAGTCVEKRIMPSTVRAEHLHLALKAERAYDIAKRVGFEDWPVRAHELERVAPWTKRRKRCPMFKDCTLRGGVMCYKRHAD